MSVRGGIDLGGTKIQAVVVDAGNAVIGQSRRPTPKDTGPEGVVTGMAEALRDAASQAGVEAHALAGVGVGSPGTIDEASGSVAQAGNVIPGWLEPFPLGPRLADSIGAAVAVGNDVRVATDAEYHLGAGRPYRSLLGVFWGTGVGGGLIIDGRSWLGRGSAGEIGHMVVKRNGATCTCGRLGCMEAYAGRASMELRARALMESGRRTSLFEIMERKQRDRLSSGVWARALEKGDRVAVHIVDRAVGALGAGIASAVNLLDVEAVVIGGGMGVRLGEPYVERITRAMFPHLFVRERPPAVHLAALGDLGGAIGAALLAPTEPTAPAAAAHG
jgi:glucokinase